VDLFSTSHCFAPTFATKKRLMFGKLLLPIALIIVSVPIAAQDLHVHYNVFRDSVAFIQNGKVTTKPYLKKGSEVVLHVDNYNNYLYNVALEVDNTEVSVATSSNPTNILSQIGGGAAMPLSFLFKGGDQMMGAFKFFPSLSGSDLSEGSGFVKSEEERAKQARVAQLRKLEADFGRTKDQLFSIDNELKTMQDQVQQKLNSQRLQTFAVSEVNQIRYNPHLEPDQIKKITSEYMERIFLEKDPNKIDLEKVLQIADAQTELPKTVQAFRKNADRYATNTVACELLMAEFRQFDFPESNLDEFRSSAEAFVGAARIKTLSHQENAAMLEEKIEVIPTLDPKVLSELRNTYLELHTNKFSKTYRHTATGENLKLKLKLTPIDSLQRQGMRTIELAPVAVNVYGGMRVRASVGLNFGQFFARPQNYFVRDSVLRSGNRDAFVPIMTSFVHFYAPSRKAVSVAGSFGIGFPLGGGENFQSISFFLGPSLLFGRSERIILNVGIMGGKVERLSQGYQVGDRYLSDSNQAPTASVYEMGVYVGVSFNLSAGAN